MKEHPYQEFPFKLFSVRLIINLFVFEATTSSLITNIRLDHLDGLIFTSSKISNDLSGQLVCTSSRPPRKASLISQSGSSRVFVL